MNLYKVLVFDLRMKVDQKISREIIICAGYEGYPV